jgi:CheY-like chemotaxis protein
VSEQIPKELPLILLVEDREDDIVVVHKAFEKTRIQTPVQVVRDGEEAIAYLAGSGKYSNRAEYPLPWLLLLDLKMPRVDGFEVIKWIRKQSGLKSLVVVVLTSSPLMKDVNDAYALGANSFMVKPLDFEDTKTLLHLIHEYWLQHNKFAESQRQERRQISGTKEG